MQLLSNDQKYSNTLIGSDGSSFYSMSYHPLTIKFQGWFMESKVVTSWAFLHSSTNRQKNIADANALSFGSFRPSFCICRHISMVSLSIQNNSYPIHSPLLLRIENQSSGCCKLEFLLISNQCQLIDCLIQTATFEVAIGFPKLKKWITITLIKLYYELQNTLWQRLRQDFHSPSLNK